MTHPRTSPINGAVGLFIFAFATLNLPIVGIAAERFETPLGFSVTETGAATFSIPIEVPPGAAGMAPSITLNYSSQTCAGNSCATTHSWK